LEIAESVDTLQARGPADLETIVVRLASRMVRLGGAAESDAAAESRVRGALTSGAALATFESMIARQAGDREIVRDQSRLPQARHRRLVTASADGYVTRLDAELVGRASMLLGAGREKVDDTIDPGAGIVVRHKPGDEVTAGEPVLELHYNDERRIDHAVQLAASAITIGSVKPEPLPLVIEHIT
jgi:pyrimidine-nucleoside phosphorylase